MTKKEILEILGDVFVGYKINVESKSKFSRIFIEKIKGCEFMVFTYNDNPSDPKAVWYFNFYFNKDSEEIMIPTGIERDFCEDILLLSTEIEESICKTNGVLTKIRVLRLESMKDKPKMIAKYRDRKLGKLGI